jgi:poly(3-hydroxybutyrate) depolymerase
VILASFYPRVEPSGTGYIEHGTESQSKHVFALEIGGFMGEIKPAVHDKAAKSSDVAVQDPHPPGDNLDSVRHQVHGEPARAEATTGNPNPSSGQIEATNPATMRGARRAGEVGLTAADGFGIEGKLQPKEAPKPEKAEIKQLPALNDKKFDADAVADEIESACNGGWTFGAGTSVSRIDNALKDLSPEQIQAVDKSFADRHGPKYASAGQRWGLLEEFKDEMSGETLDRHVAILNQKNEIPADRAVAGQDVLRDGSGLKVGEMNRVTFADGRKYDVYIPQNAQQPLPVMMLMHGASNGHDMSEQRILEKETGMNRVAEQYGFAVVYPYNEPRTVSGLFGMEKQPASWNMHGNENLLPVDEKYDDAKYLDRVLADVGARVQTDESRIGIAGMSDGGRAAEQYALERPGKINALVTQQGTWLDGNKKPEAGTGLPTMMVNSTADYMFPDDQGQTGFFGQEKGRGMMSWLASSWIPGTSASRPDQQLGVFKDANACAGDATKQTLGSLEITGFSSDQCKSGEVKQFSVKGGNHAWHDWRNDGGWYAVGMPDRNQNMSEKTAKWILEHPLKRNF